MTNWRLAFAFLVLLLAGTGARAAITCTSVASPGVSINYVANTTTNVQTQFTVSCTRTSASDPASVSYSVRADNGGNPTGINNRATHPGGSVLRYDLYTSAGCGTQWKGNNTINDAITWPGGATGTITRQTNFWGCIVTAQQPASAGLYTDSVQLTLNYGGNNANNPPVYGTLSVGIYAPALCSVVSAPGNLTLNYAAFGAQVSQSTSFGVTCTNGMPYTMSTDVPEAVLNGLRYTLGLSTTAANGTGAPQTHQITATVPAGQAGACASGSCSATRTHALTITY